MRSSAVRAFNRTLSRLQENGGSNLPSATESTVLQRAASSLLPPIPLYRSLLRAHRNHLSYEMRSLGDTYIKDEFRRHKAITNPIQIVGFLGGWKIYLDQLTGKKEGDEGVEGAAAGSVVGAQGEKVRFEGRRLAPEEFDKLSEEQLYQLHEFMTASKDLYDPNVTPGPPPPPSSPSSSSDGHLEGTDQSSAAQAQTGANAADADSSSQAQGQGQSQSQPSSGAKDEDGETILKDILDSSDRSKR